MNNSLQLSETSPYLSFILSFLHPIIPSRPNSFSSLPLELATDTFLAPLSSSIYLFCLQSSKPSFCLFGYWMCFTAIKEKSQLCRDLFFYRALLSKFWPDVIYLSLHKILTSSITSFLHHLTDSLLLLHPPWLQKTLPTFLKGKLNKSLRHSLIYT